MKDGRQWATPTMRFQVTTFLTREEVARRFKIHRKTIPALVARGVLPQPVKLDDRKNAKDLFPETEVDAAAARLLATRNQ